MLPPAGDAGQLPVSEAQWLLPGTTGRGGGGGEHSPSEQGRHHAGNKRSVPAILHHKQRKNRALFSHPWVSLNLCSGGCPLSILCSSRDLLLRTVQTCFRLVVTRLSPVWDVHGQVWWVGNKSAWWRHFLLRREEATSLCALVENMIELDVMVGGEDGRTWLWYVVEEYN